MKHQELNGDPYKINVLKVIWRSVFVMVTTVLAMSMPFFNEILAILGAIGFWPLTIYFPMEMYIARRMNGNFTLKWVMLQTLSVACLFVLLASACCSIQGVIDGLLVFKPLRSWLHPFILTIGYQWILITCIFFWSYFLSHLFNNVKTSTLINKKAIKAGPLIN